MMMQMVRIISISNGKPAMLPPLMIVVAVSMLKDAYEDYLRHQKDDEENDSKCTLISKEGKFVESKWRDLKIGSIVRVSQNEFFPADLLMIANSGTEGLCYVETKNLDGETNMKHKVAPKQLNEHFKNLNKINDINTSQIFCEVPNKDLYKFDGKMQLPISISANQEYIPLSNDNVVLRGMSLRNT